MPEPVIAMFAIVIQGDGSPAVIEDLNEANEKFQRVADLHPQMILRACTTVADDLRMQLTAGLVVQTQMGAAMQMQEAAKTAQVKQMLAKKGGFNGPGGRK